MSDGFDIGAKVRIKDTSPRSPGQQGTIVRMGMGPAEAVSDLDKVSTTWWVVQLRDVGEEEVPERDLELVAESEI